MFIEFQTINISEIIFVSISMLVFLGHNLWLVAEGKSGEIKIEAVTSDKFPESESAVKPERIADFRVYTERESVEINDYDAEGNSLTANLKANARACLVALELRPHPIVLEAEKFAGYIASEAAENSVAPQFVAGASEEAQRESYAKFAKVLIDNNAYDKIIGQKLEIVLTANPSQVEVGEKLKFRVFFDGAPMEGLRISVGAENLNGGKYFAHSRTDENGAAELEISAGGLWFARTHLIRSHANTDNFDWESFWASITFRI